MITLSLPDLSHQDAWEAMIAEWDLVEDISYVLPRSLFQGANYHEFLSQREELLHHPKNGHSPVELFFVFSDGMLVGGVTIRHRASIATLQNVGGHIEYAIRPSQRGKGYAIDALGLAIIEAKNRGLQKLLLTCFVANPAESKVAEQNGAIFTKHVEYGGERKRNYLIRISS